MNLVGSWWILIELWWVCGGWIKEANETLGLNYGNGLVLQNTKKLWDLEGSCLDS